MNSTIAKTFHFSASHMLTGLRGSHRCMNMHGHNYEVEVVIEGPVNSKTGFVFDYGDMSEIDDWIQVNFDHAHICFNESEATIVKEACIDILNSRKDDLDNYDARVYVLGRSASAENIADEIFQAARAVTPLVKSVRVRETENTWAKNRD